MPHLRQILRSLMKSPVTTGVAIASLALGIGGNTAMYSILRQVLYRTLPVTQPEHLVFLYQPGPRGAIQGSHWTDEDGNPAFSYPMYRALARQQTVFTGLAGSRDFEASLSYRNQPVRGDVNMVTGNYFEVLGIQPALGRLLTPADDVQGQANPVAVLSHRYWTRQLGASPAVLNTEIVVNGQPLTIVGVAQAGFRHERIGFAPEVFAPVTMKPLLGFGNELDDRTSYWLTLLGRLKPGVTRESAQTALSIPFASELEEDLKVYTGVNDKLAQQVRARKLELKPGALGRGGPPAEARASIYFLLGITAMVLLIACANVANLLLARATARTREIAVRQALGATRWQLVAQLLTESLAVAALAGVLGIVVAVAMLRLIVGSIPPSAGVLLTEQLDRPVFFFCAAVCLLTGLAFGLFPALQATRPAVVSAIKEQAGQSSASGAAGRFRQLLATGQIAASLMLLVAAGLFGKSLLNMTRIDLGLRADHLLKFSVNPYLNKYSPEQAVNFYEELERRMAAIPGVTVVSASSVAALTGHSSNSFLQIPGYEPGDERPRASYSQVGAGYFRTMGIPLVAGREFTAADNRAGGRVAIVNESFVRQFFGGRDPIGRQFGQGNQPPNITIAGVVRDSKYADLQERARPVFYLPYRQATRPPPLSFYARTGVDPETLAPALRAVVAALDPNLPVHNLRTMEAQITETLFAERLLMQTTAVFAALATLLAALGLYGVLAYNIARRTREIGIRMAIGASAADVRRMVLGEVAWMLGVGTLAGLAGAYAGARAVASLLYGMEPGDPVIYAAATVMLTLVGLAAAGVPTRRATRVNPVVALRYE